MFEISGFCRLENFFKREMVIYFLFSHLKELFKTIYNTLLFFHILFTSTNILIERNEMSAIFNFCTYACHVTTGVTFKTSTNQFGQQRILLYG
jgi:hypothetical protein